MLSRWGPRIRPNEALATAQLQFVPCFVCGRARHPQFNVADSIWTIDLKNGSGSLTEKAAEKADIIVTVSDDDFAALAAGTLNPQQAFMQGKIKVKGNMALAMKLNTVMAAARPKAKL